VIWRALLVVWFLVGLVLAVLVLTGHGDQNLGRW
jgi:hypothetical protein